jgi:hypothetical protein
MIEGAGASLIRSPSSYYYDYYDYYDYDSYYCIV